MTLPRSIRKSLWTGYLNSRAARTAKQHEANQQEHVLEELKDRLAELEERIAHLLVRL
jgi:hypothetical protein